MSIEDLRGNPEFTTRMAEIFSDPQFQLGLATLRAEGEADDAEPNADALASVRILSRQKGRASAFMDLMMLAVPIEKPERERVPTFGTDLSEQEVIEAMKA